MGRRSCITAVALWKLAVEDEGPAEDRLHVRDCRRCRQRLHHIREQNQLVCAAAAHCSADVPLCPEFAHCFASSQGPLSADEPFPRQIGRYLILDEIDSGGQSVVYRGWDPLFRRPVAVKLMAGGRAPLPSVFDDTFHEPALLAGFRHKNLVEIFDCGIMGQRPYIVMELVEGRTLRDVALAQKLSSRQVRRIMTELAAVVAEAHKRRIVHLDLKPENVMVDGAGQVKLIDFGLALLCGRRPPPSRDIRGTPEYMAPEQSRGDVEQYGPATDVFGLGAVLYFLMTGRTLFEGNPRDDRQTRLTLESDYRHLTASGHSRRLVHICRKALAVEPNHRFVDAGEFLSALVRWDGSSRRVRWGLLLLVVATSLTLILTLGVGVPSTSAGSSSSLGHSRRPGKPLPYLRPDLYLHFTAVVPSGHDPEVVLWSAASKSVRFTGRPQDMGNPANARRVDSGQSGLEISCRTGPVVALLVAEQPMGLSTVAALDAAAQAVDCRFWLGREGAVRVSNRSVEVEGAPLNRELRRQVDGMQRSLNRFGVRFQLALVPVSQASSRVPHRTFSFRLDR